MIECGKRDLSVLEMNAEGFEEEESHLEGLVTGKYGIKNSCADVWIWDSIAIGRRNHHVLQFEKENQVHVCDPLIVSFRSQSIDLKMFFCKKNKIAQFTNTLDCLSKCCKHAT